MKIKREPTRLEKKATRGHRGYPLATVVLYGEDASRASKVAVGIIPFEDGETTELQTWMSEVGDVRRDRDINDEILRFIQENGAKTVVLSPGIIGCPHEEGIDYPEGEVCPACPYWATRDRWTGEKLPRSNGVKARRAPVVGLGWYSEDQWQELKAIADDASTLHETYGEWVLEATRTLNTLRADGVNIRKVMVDVRELREWCEKHG